MIGPGTKAIAAEGCIVTAGAIVRTSISSARNSTTSPVPSHGTRRSDDLRRGGRKGPMEGWPRHHPLAMRGSCAARDILSVPFSKPAAASIESSISSPPRAGWEIERRNALYRDETLGAIKWADANALSQLYSSRRTARRPQ
jgi:hypothetical protein